MLTEEQIYHLNSNGFTLFDGLTYEKYILEDNYRLEITKQEHPDLPGFTIELVNITEDTQVFPGDGQTYYYVPTIHSAIYVATELAEQIAFYLK